MKKYILLLNGRRRVYMVNKMREYLKELDLPVGIALCDTDNLDPVGYYAEKFNIVPSIYDDNFKKEFIKYVKKENIKYIFLWNNRDFLAIDSIKKNLERLNIKILIPPKFKFNICFNKIKMFEFCKKFNISTPQTFLTIEDFIESRCTCPVIVKPFDGAGNMNVFKANNLEELEIFYKKVKNPIIQEYIDGDEYTIDVYYDKEVKAIVPRKRVKVRDAEVVQAKIVLDKEIIDFGKQVAESFNEYGPMNIQIRYRDNIPYLIDLHCRFGGGTDLTIEAGIPFHKWIINYFLGIENNYEYELNSKLFMTRYLKSDFIELDE